MILIIDDLNMEADICKKIDSALGNINSDKLVKRYSLMNMNIKNCMGCFSCWLKTPGVCVMKDDANEIIKEIIKCDKLVYISKITYGSHGLKVKAFLEREIPLATPFFKISHNRIHHRERYKDYPDVIFIGYGENIINVEERLFIELCNRNVINMHKDTCKCLIIKDNIEKLENFLKEI